MSTESTNLCGPNFHGFRFHDANLQGVNLLKAKGLTKKRLQRAKNWALAYYSREVLNALGLPSDHNDRITMRNLSNYSLQRTNLKGADLQGFNLNGANLQEADLCEAKGLTIEQLQGAKNWVLAYYSQKVLDAFGLPRDHNEQVRRKDFTYATWLRAANLQGADLKDAKLAGTDLRDANLQDANLKNAEGLVTKNLAGANLSNARLPDSMSEFEVLANIEELTKSTREVAPISWTDFR